MRKASSHLPKQKRAELELIVKEIRRLTNPDETRH
jgi:hypothetical protein